MLPLNTMRALSPSARASPLWWTSRESNPDSETASLVSSRWTTGPLVDLAGLEPAFSCVRSRRSPIEPQAHVPMRLVSRAAPRDHGIAGGSGGTRTHTPLIKNQVPSSSLATLPWEVRRDSNPRLPDPQSGGLGRLPTDLTCGAGPGVLGMFVGASVLVSRPLWLPLGYRAI